MIVYILDTDHLTLFQRGHPLLQLRLAHHQRAGIAITIISVEEMLRGRLAQVRRAKHSTERIAGYYWLRETFNFLQGLKTLEYDDQAEVWFQTLRQQAIRIGTQDLKIAAIALGQGATVVTRNQRDFVRVPGLSLADWSMP